MNGSGDMTAAFSEALESASAAPAVEASPVSTPAPESTTATAPAVEATAAATVQPDPVTTGTTMASAGETPKDEPPAWRWQEIKENLRKKTAEETEARVRQEIEQQYSEFKGLSADERAGLAVWQRAMAGDPAAQAHIKSAAQTNPALASTLRAFVGGEAAQPADPEPEPDAAIQLQDGTQVPVYTAEGQRKRDAWLRRQLAPELGSQLSEQFKPLAKVAEQIQRYEQQAQLQQASTQWATQVLAPLSKLPYFSDVKPQLLEALQALPAGARDEEMTAAVYDAYTRLHTDKVNGLSTSARSAVLADIHAKPAGNTIRPSAATVSLPQRPKDFYEAAQMLEQQGR